MRLLNTSSGSYEKLEHLGDAVLQFLASDFVFRKFPTLHEGHLSVSWQNIFQEFSKYIAM